MSRKIKVFGAGDRTYWTTYPAPESENADRLET
jgi:hypothetical protein